MEPLDFTGEPYDMLNEQNQRIAELEAEVERLHRTTRSPVRAAIEDGTFEALQADRDALKAENDELREAVSYYEENLCLPGHALKLQGGAEATPVATEKIGAVLRERDDLREAVRALVKAANEMRSSGSVHLHFDPRGTHGANCPACLWHQETKGRYEAALSLPAVRAVREEKP